MENQQIEECQTTSHKHVINANFGFIAMSVAVLHSYAMMYTFVFLG